MHILKVLDVILNRSYHELGFQNGRGMTYEGLLTTSSIQLAQKYYELLTKVKNGETSLDDYNEMFGTKYELSQIPIVCRLFH